ncbi:hypothetical protein C8D87_107378 [Lentzea atacamensis]|uniref:Uncharacterized protein n=1 Tax=Lentzea atacamensis TaxID=531938 RepID=A0ABX9E6N2_9PSEU|nr:hypothetical protein [Lentzea atacamensis]RAS63229.1 hypothetical protein C8D87_107378 [Lentzea atacamensis]
MLFGCVRASFGRADIDLLRQLNNDIWPPFRLAYSRMDVSAFLDLYAPELIRAGAGGPAKQVFGFAATPTRPRSGSRSSRTAAAA